MYIQDAERVVSGFSRKPTDPRGIFCANIHDSSRIHLDDDESAQGKRTTKAFHASNTPPFLLSRRNTTSPEENGRVFLYVRTFISRHSTTENFAVGLETQGSRLANHSRLENLQAVALKKLFDPNHEYPHKEKQGKRKKSQAIALTSSRKTSHPKSIALIFSRQSPLQPQGYRVKL